MNLIEKFVKKSKRTRKLRKPTHPYGLIIIHPNEFYMVYAFSTLKAAKREQKEQAERGLFSIVYKSISQYGEEK